MVLLDSGEADLGWSISLINHLNPSGLAGEAVRLSPSILLRKPSKPC